MSLRLRFSDPKLKADASEPGPRWNMLFPRGTFHRSDFPGGKITFDDALFATFVQNWEKRGKPKLAMDYHHRGPSDVPVPNEDKISSGTIDDLEVREDGFWGLVDWTERARAKINARELLYISPDWHPNAVDVSTGLRQGPTLNGGGLLIDPYFQEMPRVAASDAVNPSPARKANPEHRMNKIQMLALLAVANIKMAAETPDAEVQERLEKYVADTQKIAADAAEALRAKATSDAGVEALRASLKTKDEETAKLAADVARLSASSAKLEEERKAEGIAALQKRLISEHRIVASAQDSVKDYAMKQGLEAATKFYDTFPKGAIAPGNELGVGNPGAGGGTGGAVEELRAAAALLEKGGMKPTEALRAASRANPELAAKAFPPATARTADPVRS